MEWETELAIYTGTALCLSVAMLAVVVMGA